jgi:hypothetical protein
MATDVVRYCAEICLQKHTASRPKSVASLWRHQKCSTSGPYAHDTCATPHNTNNCAPQKFTTLQTDHIFCTSTTVSLAVVLCGCETWSVTLREKHRLRVFENRVLRGIIGSKRDGVTGEWRRLHNEELNDLC